MNATEHAAEIRKALKSRYGWTSRDVSVRSEYFSMGSAIRVTIKNAAVNPHIVRSLASGAERISRCAYSGEILSGANRYVSVSYAHEVSDEIAAKHIEAVEATEAALDAHESDSVLLPIGDTGFLLGKNSGYAGSTCGARRSLAGCRALRTLTVSPSLSRARS